MHEERVPNPSRWTQFAAFGPLVTLGDAVVGQDAPEGGDHRVAVDGCAERLSHQVDLARGLPEGAVLQHVDPRAGVPPRPGPPPR